MKSDVKAYCVGYYAQYGYWDSLRATQAYAP